MKRQEALNLHTTSMQTVNLARISTDELWRTPHNVNEKKRSSQPPTTSMQTVKLARTSNDELWRTSHNVNEKQEALNLPQPQCRR